MKDSMRFSAALLALLIPVLSLATPPPDDSDGPGERLTVLGVSAALERLGTRAWQLYQDRRRVGRIEYVEGIPVRLRVRVGASTKKLVESISRLLLPAEKAPSSPWPRLGSDEGGMMEILRKVAEPDGRNDRHLMSPKAALIARQEEEERLRTTTPALLKPLEATLARLEEEHRGELLDLSWVLDWIALARPSGATAADRVLPDALIARLGHDEFEVREAAQKQLERNVRTALPAAAARDFAYRRQWAGFRYPALSALKRRLVSQRNAADDAEIRHRLQRAIEHLDGDFDEALLRVMRVASATRP